MEIKPGIYRHYKNIDCRVIGCAKHSETLEEFVVYEHCDKKGELWIRPKTMFMEEVEVNGKMVPRFKYVSETKINDLFC